MIVGLCQHLAERGNLPTAVTALGIDVARHVGVGTELARHAFAALVRGRCVLNVGLLAARRWQRRIRRRLRRFAGTGLELSDARQQRLVLLVKLVDPRQECLVLLDEPVDSRDQR